MPDGGEIGPAAAGVSDEELASFGDTEAVVRFILKGWRSSAGPLLAGCREIGIGLLPPALGGEGFPLREVRPIVATRVRGIRPIAWRSHRFADALSSGSGVEVALHPLSSSEPPGTVEFDSATGTVRVDPAAFPADGRWRAYALARGSLFRVPPDRREVFAVALAPGTEGGAPSPGDLVLRGHVAEGWSRAVGEEWDDVSLAGLLLLALPTMTRLADEARAEPDVVDPVYAFLLDDLLRAGGSVLESLQQALIDAYAVGRGGDA